MVLQMVYDNEASPPQCLRIRNKNVVLAGPLLKAIIAIFKGGEGGANTRANINFAILRLKISTDGGDSPEQVRNEWFITWFISEWKYSGPSARESSEASPGSWLVDWHSRLHPIYSAGGLSKRVYYGTEADPSAITIYRCKSRLENGQNRG